MSKIKLLLDVVEDMRSLADSIQAVANAMMQNTPDDEPPFDTTPVPTPKPVEPPAAPKKVITLEQVRAVLAEKSHEGLTAEVRALLLKYGAPKLSGIDPANYEALMADAEVLTHASK